MWKLKLRARILYITQPGFGNDIFFVEDLSQEFVFCDIFCKKIGGIHDQQNLNKLRLYDKELNPSAKKLARYLLEYVASRVNDDRVQVYKVRCYETPTSVATYQIN